MYLSYKKDPKGIGSLVPSGCHFGTQWGTLVYSLVHTVHQVPL
jgi:hypothetical protein